MHRKGMQRAGSTGRLHVLVEGSVVPKRSLTPSITLKMPWLSGNGPLFPAALLATDPWHLLRETSASLFHPFPAPRLNRAACYGRPRRVGEVGGCWMISKPS